MTRWSFRKGQKRDSGGWPATVAVLAAGLPPTTNRMYTVGANGIRLGRGERGAHRTARSYSRGVRGTYDNGPMVIEVQERKSERRRLCLGETNAARLLTFVITERNERIRFVMAHPMHAKQREIYRGEE
jgi:hypothetical protein